MNSQAKQRQPFPPPRARVCKAWTLPGQWFASRTGSVTGEWFPTWAEAMRYALTEETPHP